MAFKLAPLTLGYVQVPRPRTGTAWRPGPWRRWHWHAPSLSHESPASKSESESCPGTRVQVTVAAALEFESPPAEPGIPTRFASASHTRATSSGLSQRPATATVTTMMLA